MTCAACGAATARRSAYCAVCGLAQDGKPHTDWNRTPEALAYEDLSRALADGEALLALTRGRVAGNWRPSRSLNPQSFLSPFANVGLTPNRLLVQQIHQGTGRALGGRPSAFPLSELHSLSVADADPFETGRTLRLVAHLQSGESVRLKVIGRFVHAAREMVEVWHSLCDTAPLNQSDPPLACPACRRPLDRLHRYCPYCGARQDQE